MNYQFQTENSSTMRGCVFIDSSNPELPNQVMNHSSHPFIKPAFPPLIDPKDLLIISKDNKPSRSPNAFIIYRKVFLKTTRDQGYFLPMTIVSSMASKSWDQESEEVRNYYKKLAKDAYKYRTEQFPKKIKRRRRKEPWKTNNITFQNDLHQTQPVSPTLQPVKNETSIIVPDMFTLSNNDNFSQNPSPNLEQQFNEPSLFNENDLSEFFSSPNLSNNSSIMPSPVMNEITINDNPNLLDEQSELHSELFNKHYESSELLNNDNSEPICYNNYNNLEQLNMEIWQQLLLNQNNLSEIMFPNEINNEMNNYSNYSDYNPNYNDYYNDYYTTASLNADFPVQDALGISFNNPIEGVYRC